MNERGTARICDAGKRLNFSAGLSRAEPCKLINRSIPPIVTEKLRFSSPRLSFRLSYNSICQARRRVSDNNLFYEVADFPTAAEKKNIAQSRAMDTELRKFVARDDGAMWYGKNVVGRYINIPSSGLNISQRRNEWRFRQHRTASGPNKSRITLRKPMEDACGESGRELYPFSDDIAERQRRQNVDVNFNDRGRRSRGKRMTLAS